MAKNAFNLITFSVFVFFIVFSAGINAENKNTEQSKSNVALKQFSISNVRLLDGPFLRRQEQEKSWLLILEPDKFLHPVRVVAGIPSNVPDYYEREGYTGHLLGHYLSATAQMYLATGDVALKNRAAVIVSGLAECQAKTGNGYVSTFPEVGVDRVMGVKGDRIKGADVPWYNLHKIAQGLLDQYIYCDNKQALDVLLRFVDWAKAKTDSLNDEQMQKMLETEYGGMNDVLAQLYKITIDKKHLDLSIRFNQKTVLDNACKGYQVFKDLHANTTIPKFVGLAEQYNINGCEESKHNAECFWNHVIEHYTYPNGGNSDQEHFRNPDSLFLALSYNTTETCNIYNMIKLSSHLLCWNPETKFSDYQERALLNQIFASQDAVSGKMLSYVPIAPGSMRTFYDPRKTSACCQGTGMENHARYGELIYFQSPNATDLYVSQFIASDLNWNEKKLKLRQETGFPNAESSRIIISKIENPVDFNLHIRKPSWAGNDFVVSVNGTKIDNATLQNNWLVVSRTWKANDVVIVHFPMKLRYETFKNNPNCIALFYGPTLLAGTVPAGVRDAYVVAANKESVLTGLQPISGTFATFTTPTGLFKTSLIDSENKPVVFKPMYACTENGYTSFWNFIPHNKWNIELKRRKDDVRFQLSEKGRKIDEVGIYPLSEKEHSYRSFKTYWRGWMRYNRDYRITDVDGWMEWTLKLPDFQNENAKPLELRLTLWTGDSENCAMDILVDGLKVGEYIYKKATKPQFINPVFSVPAALLQNKDRIVVRVSSQKGKRSGSVHGLALLYPLAK